MTLILLAIIQSLLLCAGQVLLKYALNAMGTFSWTGKFFVSQLTNWWWLGCGICFLAAGLLWMYIVKKFPFSMAYPMVSLSYVFGMLAAVFVFKEHVDWTQWLGVLFIMGGCFLIAK